MKLSVEHLTKTFGEKRAVDDVSFTLTGGVYGLLGPNGAGKTTLMKMLVDILPPYRRAGDIKRGGYPPDGGGLPGQAGVSAPGDRGV